MTPTLKTETMSESKKTTKDFLHQEESAEAIREYKKLLRELNESGADIVFANGKPAHAAAIFEEFFRSALDRVAIFCRDLNPSVYANPELLVQLAGALRRGVKVDIICQEPPATGPVANLAGPAKNLSVRLAGKDSQRNVAVNFAVMDGRAVRVEPDREEPSARANFNSPELAAELLKIFDRYLGESNTLPRPA